jgi:chloride channel protein, CIC family
VVGVGSRLAQRVLTVHDSALILLITFLMTIPLGPVSYATATLGEIFTPLLAMGAQSGLLFGTLCLHLLLDLAIQREAFVLVGMPAFLIGVARAPVTGTVLVIEMTINVTMLLPMQVTDFGAMLVPTLSGDCDSVRENILRRERERPTKIRVGSASPVRHADYL